MYAIVRNGSRQHKVEVGSVLNIDDLTPEVGATVELPVVMLVNDGTLSTDTEALAKAKVTAEVLGAAKGPKIHILKFKNKSGYRKRQGHRQHYTTVKITDIAA
ncbi:MAG: 50S ribosomal protein L21 [Propionibacteriaceae bacterium]|nr:50S ribosomal protein L21 [Propionibacteriaceae bacterium]